MFQEIFLFDLKANLKRPITWIFFAIFFVLSALITAAAGGLIGSAQGESNTYFNSSLALAQIINSIVNNSLIGTIILVAIIAPAVQKDFQYNSHSIYFTKPISKFGYMMGRFLSAFVTALVVLSACVLAFLIMCNLPLYDAGKFGNYGVWNYLQGFVYLVIPNTLFVGALFFAIVTYTRNMLSGYIASIVLMVLLGVAGTLTKDVDNSLIPSLLDPYGNTALGELTKYWTAQEQNTTAIPFNSYLLYNRLLWMAISGFLFFITYKRFSFQQISSSFKWFKKKQISESTIASTTRLERLPSVSSIFDNGLSWQLFFSLSKLEFKNLIKSSFFIIMSIIALISIYFSYDSGNDFYGTGTLPVSYSMIGSISQFANLMGLIMIVFYAGVLVWRERDAKMEEIISATPIKSWVLLLSKITSLTMMYVALIFICMLFCILIQLFSGFTDIQPMVYIKSLFGYGTVGILVIISLCVALQVLVNNRYLGYFLCILVLMIYPLVLRTMDIQNGLISFNSSGPNFIYSDMNGYGHRLFPFTIHKLYWFGFISILLITANLLWQRGKEQNFKSRLIFAKNTITKKHLFGYIAGIACMVGFGSFIHYNTRLLNKFETPDQQDEQLANYEKRNKKYNTIPKLKITDVNVKLNLFPETRSLDINASFWLKNKGTQPVNQLLLGYQKWFSDFEFNFTNNAITLLINDTISSDKLIQFSKPILPNDSVQFNFSYKASPKGFKQGDAQTEIVFNGSFLSSMQLFPSIGYNEESELDDNVKRKKYGLPEKERMHPVTDTIYLKENCLTPEADWVNYECIISTSADQTAISPGYLAKKWTENNRNYFHYKMDKKINYFFSYQSAEYLINKDKWNDVNLEIYYDKHHPYNIEGMNKAMKKSLDYFSKNFGSYQFKQLRIQEFPRYQSFAQSFANTIPFSEAIGFISAPDFREPDAIDYNYFVTAHEIAHQWWAHQVIGANVKGAFLMSESFAEYSALRVMEKEYGKQAMRKFLKYELDQYLTGRAFDKRNEDVLRDCQGQQHIHYQKGAVIIYGISDLIGEQAMNNLLKSYVDKVAFQEPPYTTSYEFIAMLKAATPDSLHYAIVDGFEKITLYENRCKDVSYTKLPNGKYKVTVVVEAMKLYANAKGKKTQATINDYIDIAVFAKGKSDKEPIELFNVKHKLKSGFNTFEVIVDKEPYSAGIDPYIKLIDRNSDDNVRKVSDKAPLKKIDINDDAGAMSIIL